MSAAGKACQQQVEREQVQPACWIKRHPSIALTFVYYVCYIIHQLVKHASSRESMCQQLVNHFSSRLSAVGLNVIHQSPSPE
jgi:hypothetical protein